MRWFCSLTCFAVLILTASTLADPIPKKYQASIKRGLQWLQQRQNKDGSWTAKAGSYRCSMTSLAGLALLMDGSTTTKGPYKKNLQRAVEWLLEQQQQSGLFLDKDDKAAAARYVFEHGYSLLFLSHVLQKETKKKRAAKLKTALTDAVQFSRNAQTPRGGWGYVTAVDGNNFDEGAATVVQMMGLRAAKDAKIRMPQNVFEDGAKYFQAATNKDGGIIYSVSSGRVGSGRPALTAGAMAVLLGTKELKKDLAKKWLTFVTRQIKLGQRMGHAAFTHFHYAQVAYRLGEKGHGKIHKESKPADRLTWTQYRKATFVDLKRRQSKDGSWPGSIGPEYETAIALCILQLDKEALAIAQQK